MNHCFRDGKDVVVPYPVASAYLEQCHKESVCVEIDPEAIPSSAEGKRVCLTYTS